MWRKLLSVFKSSSPLPSKQKRDQGRYEREKKQAASKNVKDRLTLARNSKTHQEILYYLAEKDPEDSVRKAVAANPSTPLQAGNALAMDANPDVRMALAKRLIKLVPHLSQDNHSQLYAYTVQALGTLALDEVLKIRIALSSALKDIAQTPPKVANTLARDIERQVAEPILLCCAALSDDDLVDIIKGHSESWAVQAIASRDNISESVSEAVIDKEDPQAGAKLVENQGAQISDLLLENIIEKAKTIPEWQKPIARRPSLPKDKAKELASFAQDSVRDILTRRKDMDPETCDEIAKVFERRLELANENAQSPQGIDEKIKEMEKQGRLDEENLIDYLGMRQNDVVIAMLARMAGTSARDVRRILKMKAAKPVVALCWHAGLSMRAALQIEKELARIDPKKLLYPRDGTKYPLGTDEIEWQLEFLGLKAA